MDIYTKPRLVKGGALYLSPQREIKIKGLWRRREVPEYPPVMKKYFAGGIVCSSSGKTLLQHLISGRIYARSIWNPLLLGISISIFLRAEIKNLCKILQRFFCMTCGKFFYKFSGTLLYTLCFFSFGSFPNGTEIPKLILAAKSPSGM